MALDSDIPNASSHTFVQFYTFQDPPYKGQTFIRKMNPGDQLNIVERPMREHDKTDFPQQWLGFLAKSSEDEIVGTPLKQWNFDRPTEITHAQMDELRMIKFMTVEQVRDASDLQLQRLGMGGQGLREKARLYLAGKNQAAETAEMSQMKAELAELKARKPLNVVHNDAATHAAGNE